MSYSTELDEIHNRMKRDNCRYESENMPPVEIGYIPNNSRRNGICISGLNNFFEIKDERYWQTNNVENNVENTTQILKLEESLSKCKNNHKNIIHLITCGVCIWLSTIR